MQLDEERWFSWEGQATDREKRAPTIASWTKSYSQSIWSQQYQHIFAVSFSSSLDPLGEDKGVKIIKN